MLNRSTVVSLVSDAVLQLVDDEALVVSLTDEAIFSLNQTGARIVTLLSEGRSVGEAVDRLAQEYSANPSDLERDVVELVGALLARGLVTVSDRVGGRVSDKAGDV